MATNFPNSPSNGDTHVFGGTTYTYNSTKGVWNSSASSGGGGASVTTDDTAPSSPSDGDLWWDSAGGKMYVYYEDTDSSQWVSVSVPGSTGPAGADASPTSYTNFAGFPSSGNTLGDFAIAQDTKALYVWDGTEWDRIAAGSDESPVILTEPPTTIQLLNSDGTTSTVTMTAQDPEGFDITYGIAYKTTNNARPAQLSADTTINQTTGVYTFTPSTTTSNAGDFRARLSASDGVNTTTRLVDFRLEFAYTSSQAAIDDGATAGIQSFLINGTSTDLYYDGNGWILYASFANDNTYDATNYPALVGNRLLYTDIVSSNGFAWNNAPGNYADGVTDTMGGYSRIAGRFAYFSSSANTAGLTISSWQGPSTASHIRTVWGNGHSGLSSGTYLFINNTQEVYDTSYYNTTPRTDDYAFNLSGTTPIWELREANGIAGIESIWFKF